MPWSEYIRKLDAVAAGMVPAPCMSRQGNGGAPKGGMAPPWSCPEAESCSSGILALLEAHPIAGGILCLVFIGVALYFLLRVICRLNLSEKGTHAVAASPPVSRGWPPKIASRLAQEAW
jgi:hypothetical protein